MNNYKYGIAGSTVDVETSKNANMPAKFHQSLDTDGKAESDVGEKKTLLELAHPLQDNAKMDAEVSMNTESGKDISSDNESVSDNKDVSKGGKGQKKRKAKVRIFVEGYFC